MFIEKHVLKKRRQEKKNKKKNTQSEPQTPQSKEIKKLTNFLNDITIFLKNLAEIFNFTVIKINRKKG